MRALIRCVGCYYESDGLFMKGNYSHARKQQKRAAQGMVLEAILARRGPQREPEAMKQ
jgi:hypothetical protein